MRMYEKTHVGMILVTMAIRWEVGKNRFHPRLFVPGYCNKICITRPPDDCHFSAGCVYTSLLPTLLAFSIALRLLYKNKTIALHLFPLLTDIYLIFCFLFSIYLL